MIRVFVLLLLASNLFADGSALYTKYCAVCHKAEGEDKAGRAMPLASLKSRTVAQIRKALDSGVMNAQGAVLTAGERLAVSEYLGKPDSATAIAVQWCDGAGPNASTKPKPLGAITAGWNGWGVDSANTRFQPNPGIQSEDVPNLKLKWAFGFPNADSAMAQPTIAGGRLFFGSGEGTVYAVDAKSGCAYWTFAAPTTVRSAIVVQKAGAKTLAVFGDIDANAYAVDAETGKLAWKRKVEDHRSARVTAAAAYHAGVVYIPVSSVEEVAAGGTDYKCCTFRGSVVALDLATGKQIWKAYVIPEVPTSRGMNKNGIEKFGPSGAGIWSAPTIDAKLGLLYVGTGDGYSDPAPATSDAVVAIDLKTGAIKWSRQLTPGDSWNYSCASPDRANCPEKPGDDLDIGSSPILRVIPGGKRVLLVGQKSGVMHGLDPDQKGEIVWQTRVGQGSAIGGIMWGSAADADTVYIPLSDLFVRKRVAPPGGLFALDIATGKLKWSTPAPKPTCAGKPGCSQAQIAPSTVIPGVAFSGSMDGHLRAYAALDGKIIWDFDTRKEFPTVNGVAARGGSLSATGPTIHDGLMYVNSGYGTLAGIPGNVLLVFGVE